MMVQLRPMELLYRENLLERITQCGKFATLNSAFYGNDESVLKIFILAAKKFSEGFRLLFCTVTSSLNLLVGNLVFSSSNIKEGFLAVGLVEEISDTSSSLKVREKAE